MTLEGSDIVKHPVTTTLSNLESALNFETYSVMQLELVILLILKALVIRLRLNSTQSTSDASKQQNYTK